MTRNQELAWEAYRSGDNLMLSGMAGTGKTYLSLYLALRDVEAGRADRVVIVRSIVSARDPGFLPGTLREKTRVYEAPYQDIVSELYGRDDAYETMKTRGAIDFVTTSFMRGTTLSRCVIVIDELQNMRWGEISSVITRVGKGARVIALGDFRQSDLTRADEKRGITDFLRVVRRMPSFTMIEFGRSDILRSDLVKEFLIARDELGIPD